MRMLAMAQRQLDYEFTTDVAALAVVHHYTTREPTLSQAPSTVAADPLHDEFIGANGEVPKADAVGPSLHHDIKKEMS